MFDFLIKYPISIFEIKEFLAAALNCPFDKILVVSSGENADLEIAAEELDKLCCLCIGTEVEGDAAWLLNHIGLRRQMTKSKRGLSPHLKQSKSLAMFPIITGTDIC